MTNEQKCINVTLLYNGVTCMLYELETDTMKDDKMSTLELIHQAAKQEFMEKGYQTASLRNIVKAAGVTTGAFYGYYDSKEEVFDALVKKHAEYVFSLLVKHIDDFEKLSGPEQTEHMMDNSEDGMNSLLNYMYQYRDEFKLLICFSDGTKYANFIHQLVEKEVDSTIAYMEILKKMGHTCQPIQKNLIHMISSGLFTGIFETVIHDMPREEATEYVNQLYRFHAAGWEELFGVRFGKKE